MKNFFCLFSILLLINLFNPAAAADQQQTVDGSFRVAIKRHLDSYKLDPRATVYSIGFGESGWRKSQCAVTGRYFYDIQPTGLVNRPYTAQLTYRLYMQVSAIYTSRDAAEMANKFPKYTAPDTYRITFQYRDGNWIPVKYETQFQTLPGLPPLWLTLENTNSDQYRQVVVKP
ncbi:hypothetical protein [Propionispora hippei]|uniref:Uncharacterized protein n=1 Tax=Propionispora hippei DSM 15287 TaxID=1123003 RepID=A0A1M6D0K0_9FIRM|nr:hypothetical protein [Propionispora hippei]SHI66623.1 hypothetical protein SAMN02745170_00799 [Propionispora hippei DSM 15287]